MTTFSCFLAGSGASAFAIAAAGLAAGSGEMGAGDDCAAEAGGLPLCICGLARGSRKGLSEAAVFPKGCRRRRLTVGSTSGDSARAHGARWRARHGIALYSEWNFSMGRRRNGDRPVVTSRRTKQEVCKRQGDDERAGEHGRRESVDFRRLMHFMHGGCGFSKGAIRPKLVVLICIRDLLNISMQILPTNPSAETSAAASPKQVLLHEEGHRLEVHIVRPSLNLPNNDIAENVSAGKSFTKRHRRGRVCNRSVRACPACIPTAPYRRRGSRRNDVTPQSFVSGTTIANTSSKPASRELVTHIFRPDSFQPPSTFFVRVRSENASLPEANSERLKATSVSFAGRA